MRNPNETLPDNIKELIEHLNTPQAIPLGSLSGISFSAVKIPSDKDAMLEATVLCDLRPAVFNIDFDDVTVAICFIRYRLNTNDAFTYTSIYDLTNEKQFNDCYTLLGMEQFGLLVASDDVHDFISFQNRFNGGFNPLNIIVGAKEQATEYTPEQFTAVVHAFYSSAANELGLWNSLESMTPLEHQCYGRMSMQIQPVSAS